MSYCNHRGRKGFQCFKYARLKAQIMHGEPLLKKEWIHYKDTPYIIWTWNIIWFKPPAKHFQMTKVEHNHKMRRFKVGTPLKARKSQSWEAVCKMWVPKNIGKDPSDRKNWQELLKKKQREEPFGETENLSKKFGQWRKTQGSNTAFKFSKMRINQ